MAEQGGFMQRQWTRKVKNTLFIVFSVYFMVVPAVKSFAADTENESIHANVPDKIDLQAKYLFYLHGAWPEQHNLTDKHPEFGEYRYDKVAERFVKEGFQLIFTPRLKPVKSETFAEKIVKQVRELNKKGVRAENIYIMGHSKGAFITFKVAMALNMENLNVIILAGCLKEKLSWAAQFKKELLAASNTVKGRFLSIYDLADVNYGSCKYALAPLPNVTLSEVVFETGKGHGLFYEPHDNWVKAVTEWAEKKE
jgi:hypothetical protein